MNGSRLALWRNTTTLVGAVILAGAVLFIVSFLFFDILSPTPSPYLGLFTYLILPGGAVIGGMMIVIGLLAARRRLRRDHGDESRAEFYPRIDLNNRRHRRALATVGIATAVALPVIGLLSYEGYHYTDSNEFCGLVCHTVMTPQYTAYLQSPHARVSCAECHIGAGASWYVKSKLSGIRQVLAVATDSFPRPIPPAIRELRPATETCRQCHWPSKFYGDQLVHKTYFASDEANSPRHLRMLIRTGGSDPTTGPPSGIHWHMALGFTIEYVAIDDLLQEIPWVRVTDHGTGRKTIYRSDGAGVTDPPPTGIQRTMDCMDCHNRPTHIFRAPDVAANVALNVYPSLRTLPYAKREMVAALTASYPSQDEAIVGVIHRLRRFYQETMPEVWRARHDDVEEIAATTAEIYKSNFFPEMNVSWQTYPDNIGHKLFPGCFRCHEGNHIDERGTAISHNCASCHEFLTPQDGETSSLVAIGEFAHPVPLEGIHATLRCNLCHSGGAAPPATCDGCHENVSALRAGSTVRFQPFKIAADPMAAAVNCDGCHDLSVPLNVATMDATCVDCHEDEADVYGGMLQKWHDELEPSWQTAYDRANSDIRSILDELKGAGMYHNVEAARAVIRGGSGGAATADQNAAVGESSRKQD
ncbi:MAG: cytochrome C [Phycisphaerales bacterium]|nr:cytochrome C [Phycisphaerales bacterium]